jgi:hypothetical protein
MNLSFKEQDENEYPTYFYIHLFFVFTGLIFYAFAYFLFIFIVKDISYIKKEVFTFLVVNSLKSIVEITLSTSLTKEIIIYFFEISEFYLVLTYINKSLTTKKISQNTSNYELEHFYYIMALFIIFFFPYEPILNLTGKVLITYNTIKIVLSILLFRYIFIKMQLLLEYLREKKMATSAIPDIYLPNVKANYYYNNFYIINILFYLILGLTIVYYILKILDLFILWKTISIYLILFTEESIYVIIIISNLIFFYTIHKNKLLKRRKKKDKTEEEVNLGGADVDIKQDDPNNLSEKEDTKNDKNIDDNEEEKKIKKNIKNSEENEILKE